MTFKDLQKLVHSNQSNPEQLELFNRLKNKPFWIWNIEQHKKQDIKTKGDCCFNHIVGLPTKENKEKPLYDYEKIIFDNYQVLLLFQITLLALLTLVSITIKTSG